MRHPVNATRKLLTYKSNKQNNEELPSLEKKQFLQVTMEIESVSKVYSVDFVVEYPNKVEEVAHMY